MGGLQRKHFFHSFCISFLHEFAATSQQPFLRLDDGILALDDGSLALETKNTKTMKFFFLNIHSILPAQNFCKVFYVDWLHLFARPERPHATYAACRRRAGRDKSIRRGGAAVGQGRFRPAAAGCATVAACRLERRECDSSGFNFRVYFRMIPGNVFSDVGGAVQQQAAADDFQRRLDDDRVVVDVTLCRDVEG